MKCNINKIKMNKNITLIPSQFHIQLSYIVFDFNSIIFPFNS